MVASDISGMVFVKTKAKSADGLAISRILVSTHGIVPLPQPSNRLTPPPAKSSFLTVANHAKYYYATQVLSTFFSPYCLKKKKRYFK